MALLVATLRDVVWGGVSSLIPIPNTSTLSDTTLSQEAKAQRLKRNAARCIAKAWKRYKETHILVAQLDPTIQAKFPELQQRQQQNLSQFFCKAMNTIKKQEDKWGFTFVIKASSRDERYPIWLKDPKRYGGLFLFKNTHDARIKVSEDGAKIHLFVIPQIKQVNQLLGSGVYKKVFALHEISFPLSMQDGKRPVTYTPRVLHIPQEGHGERKEHYSEQICLGLKEHTNLMASLSDTLREKMMPLPEGLLRGDKKEKAISVLPFEFVQNWYNADLHQGIKTRTIPLTFASDSPLYILKNADILNAFSHVAEQLAIMHKQKKVHLDVKPANILLKLTQDEKSSQHSVHGFLSDFDLEQPIGRQLLGNPKFPHWDSLSRDFAIATPFSDCYGLAISFLGVLVPAFRKHGVLMPEFKKTDVLLKNTLLNYSQRYGKSYHNVLERQELDIQINNCLSMIRKILNDSHEQLVITKCSNSVLLKFLLTDECKKLEKNETYCKDLITLIDKVILEDDKDSDKIPKDILIILKNLKNELLLRDFLEAFGLEAVQQDLARVRKAIEICSQNAEYKKNEWSTEETFRFLEELEREAPSLSAIEMQTRLCSFRETYLKEKIPTHEPSIITPFINPKTHSPESISPASSDDGSILGFHLPCQLL